MHPINPAAAGAVAAAETIDAGGVGIWVERRGAGPDVLLIGGTSDVVEAWQPQLDGLADRYRLTAFDNRGAGRTAFGGEPLTIAAMADDAAAVLRAYDVPAAHVMGFSQGSCIAQELALRHPDAVRSLVLVSTFSRPDALLRSQMRFWRWLAGAAPDERRFCEAFFTWIYTPRAHDEGAVAEIVEEALAFPHPQSLEGFQAQVDACLAHDTTDRLHRIAVPTLVLAGEYDTITPPRHSRRVAEAIPGARFEILPEEAHQPFQEIPEWFNARVDAFWRELDA